MTDTDPWADDSGAERLDQVEAFLARFVAYPSEAARVAHVLWIAHTWVMGSWESTPRIAFLSPEPGSGKSRALEVTELLVPRPVHAVNVSPAYLFRKVSDESGPPTILYDEIDTVFGPKAKDNEDVRGMLNAGHRRGATAGRCVVRGKIIETEELPAYCAVALAGLNDLPDTIMSRCVVIRMRRRAPSEKVEAFRQRLHAGAGHQIGAALNEWIESHKDELEQAWPTIPGGIEDRNADCWEPLLAVADLAGGAWPGRARVAAVALVAESRAQVRETLGVKLLADLRTIFDKHQAEHLATATILEDLNALDESPWGDIRGKALDARGLSRRLRKYEIKPRPIRSGSDVFRGYSRDDLDDAWARYLPHPRSRESVTSVTPLQPEPERNGVTDVTDIGARGRDCAVSTCTHTATTTVTIGGINWNVCPAHADDKGLCISGDRLGGVRA